MKKGDEAPAPETPRSFLEGQFQDGLSRIGFSIAVLYLGFALVHPLVVPELSAWLSPVAIATAGVSGFIGWAAARSLIPRHGSDAVGFVLALIVLSNVLVHVYLSGEAKHLSHVFLVLFAASAFFASRRWFLCLAGTAGCLLVTFGLLAVGDFEILHWCLGLLICLVVCWMILDNRLTTASGIIVNQELATARGKRLEAVVQTSIDAVLWIDRRGLVTDLNPAGCRMLGWEREEIVGRPLTETILPESSRAPFALALQKGGRLPEAASHRMGGNARRRDGSMFSAELTIQSVRNGGEGLTYVGFLRDATEAIERENRLQQETQRAQSASEAKSQFLARISHELRTPLNAILGVTDLLVEEPLSYEQHELVKRAESSAEYLLGLLGDLLDLSRIESGLRETEIKSFSLYGLIDEAACSSWSRANAGGIDLVVDVKPSTPDQIISDPIAVQQILTNLVGNAVKFTERGGVHLSAGSLPDRRLQLVVEDTGPGIPESFRSRMFDDFTQGSDTLLRSGVGLGLAIVKRLVDTLDGEIRYEEPAGGGSRFVVEIPVDRDPKADRSGTELGVIVGIRTSDSIRRVALENTLTSIGCTVVDGRESAPQVVIVDAEEPAALIADALALGAETVLVGECSGGELVGTASTRDLDERVFSVPRPLGPVQLRRAIQRHSSCAAERTPAVASLPIPTACDAPRVLVVEDNETNGFLITQMLLRQGCEVLLASRGDEALASWKEFRPDCIMLDLGLPDMDGVDVAREILRCCDSAGPRPQIIAVTASATAETRRRVLEAGIDGFLSKPVRLHQVVAAIEDCRRRDEPSASREQAFDAAVLLERVDHDGTVAQRLLELFLGQSAEDAALLEEAITLCDYPSVRRLTHKLSGSLADIAADDIRLAVIDIGTAARDEASERMTRSHRIFAAGLEELCGEIRSELERLGIGGLSSEVGSATRSPGGGKGSGHGALPVA